MDIPHKEAVPTEKGGVKIVGGKKQTGQGGTKIMNRAGTTDSVEQAKKGVNIVDSHQKP